MPESVPVHFWLPVQPDASFREWLPALDPGRYLSGVSHGALQLYKRLEQRGRAVTIGPAPPRRGNIVFHLETPWRWQSMTPAMNVLFRLLAVLARNGVGTAIRSDVPLTFAVRMRGVIEVMPNRSSMSRNRQTWIPLLPQRGMLHCSPERFGTVASVALIGMGSNVPEALRSAEFTNAVERIGLKVVTRIADSHSDEPRWHDYREIDCVIAVHRDHLRTGLLRKPPTGLINAWAAGAIPIVGRDPAFLELARPTDDCLVIDGVEDVLPALERLRVDQDLVARLESGGRERAHEFARERVLDQWEDLLFSPRAAPGKVSVATDAVRVWTTAALHRLAGPRRFR